MLEETSVPKEWELEADVVIIGAGTAGLAGAIEAAKAGAKVLVLEQMPACSGSLSVYAGNINFAGSDFQQKLGIEDSPDEYYQDGLDVCQGEPAMWRKFVDNHLDTYKMIVGLGYEPSAVWLLPGHSKQRSHYFVGEGPELLKQLEHGSRTYYFIAVEIAEQTKPISQRDKGKPVKTTQVKLAELLSQ